MQSPEKMVKKQNLNNLRNYFNGDVEDQVDDLIDLNSPKAPTGIVVEDLKQKKKGGLKGPGDNDSGSSN